jgi:cold shock CspA family protein
VLKHTIERTADGLRVQLDIDLPEAVAYFRDTAKWHAYEARIAAYLKNIERDIKELIPVLAQDAEIGVVKWWNESLGSGFIRGYDKVDIFVHHRAIAGNGFKNLTPGDQVSFKRQWSKRVGKESYEAVEVEPIQ